MSKTKSCEERVKSQMDGRLEDIRKLWAAYGSGEEDVEDLGNIYEYGLCFDYVAPGTFGDQPEAFFRWQLSTGGPGDEFRFFVNPDLSVHRAEYWFLDWFDGAHQILKESDEELLLEIFQWFNECGTVEAQLKEAMESE